MAPCKGCDRGDGEERGVRHEAEGEVEDSSDVAAEPPGPDDDVSVRFAFTGCPHGYVVT